MQPTKVKKITRTTANAMVHQVEDKLEEIQRETQSRYYHACIKTDEYKEVRDLSSKIKSLNRQFHSKGKALKNKWPQLDIDTWSDGELRVGKNCRLRGLDNKRIASELLTANHIDGIAIDGLVSHVVKKELARKEPKCD